MDNKQGVDLKRVLMFYLKHWYVFVCIIAIAVIVSKIYNRYLIPIYNIKTTLLIKDKSTSILLPSGVSSVSNSKIIDNEIEMMKSCLKIEKAIDSLDFMVSYYVKGDIQTSEIYKNSPFIVEYDSNHKQLYDKIVSIKLLDSLSYVLNSESKSHTKLFFESSYPLNQWIEDDEYKFLIKLKPNRKSYQYLNYEFLFKINHKSNLVSEYCEKLRINLKPGTSILIISSNGINRGKEKDFLNALARVYIKDNLDRKDELSNNMINFINDQIEKTRLALNTAETELENFRRENKLMTLKDKVAPILSRVNTLNKNKGDQYLDLKYFKYLEEYIKTHDNFDDLVSPATIGISIPVFSKMLWELQLSYVEKENLMSNASEINPYIKTLDVKIKNQKVILLESISNTIEVSEMKINDFDQRIEKHLLNFDNLPRLERKFIAISRIYKLNSEMYNYFLKKLSEAEILKTQNAADLTLIEKAGGDRRIAASAKSTYAKAIVFALIIPSVFLFLLFLFHSRRISFIEDVAKHTSYPVIGKLYHNYSPSAFYLTSKPYALFAQAVKKIRSQIISQKDEGTVISVTSSNEKEGKTFVSVNMALSYALTGKKVILLDFNFYKPEISRIFNIDPNIGLADLLNPLNDKKNYSDMIYKDKNTNLDLLPSGTYCNSIDTFYHDNRIKDLFDDLKRDYDFIIVDMSSLSASADTYEMREYIDVTLFVIRHKFTLLTSLTETLQYNETSKLLPNLQIVYNDIRTKKSKYFLPMLP